jgi:hypothetical protein
VTNNVTKIMHALTRQEVRQIILNMKYYNMKRVIPLVIQQHKSVFENNWLALLKSLSVRVCGVFGVGECLQSEI